MPRIVFTLEDNSVIEAELDVDIITIGRNSENGFVIPSASVSSYHARITRQGEDFFVQDLGSTNGTKLNGVEIEEAKLDDGDYLAFGDIRGVVHLYDAIQPLAADVYVAEPVAAVSSVPTPQLSSVAKLDALSRPQKPVAPRIQSRPLVKQKYKESSGCGGFFFTLLLLAGAFIIGLHIRHAADNGGKVLIIDIGKKFRDGAYGQINGITKPKTAAEPAPKEDAKPAEPEKPAAKVKPAPPAPAPEPAPAMSDSPAETPATPAPAPAPAPAAPAAPEASMDGSPSMMGQ